MQQRVDESEKPRDTGKDAGAFDRLDRFLKPRRLADPRTRRHILAKIDAILSGRRN